jgi:hypothetical protein
VFWLSSSVGGDKSERIFFTKIRRLRTERNPDAVTKLKTVPQSSNKKI